MTKGEWEVIGNFIAVQMKDGNSYEICKVSNHQPESKENAYLIAAAPEMYKALQHALNWIDTHILEESREIAEYLESVIKKAEECGQ